MLLELMISTHTILTNKEQGQDAKGVPAGFEIPGTAAMELACSTISLLLLVLIPFAMRPVLFSDSFVLIQTSFCPNSVELKLVHGCQTYQHTTNQHETSTAQQLQRQTPLSAKAVIQILLSHG
jgi:hypothetical protein